MPFVPQPFGTEETLASLDETTPIAGLEAAKRNGPSPIGRKREDASVVNSP